MVTDRAGVPAASRLEQHEFTVARKGYDRGEVRALLRQLAEERRRVEGQLAELERRNSALEAAIAERDAAPTGAAVRPGEATGEAAPVGAGGAPLDEAAVVAAVGEELATALRTAHSAARDLRGKAEAEAEQLLAQAREQIAAERADSERLLGEVTAEAERAGEELRAAATAEANRILAQAEQEAARVRGEADRDRRLTIEGAQAARERILADLARRRRVATVQIEQLRAGRERLLASYAVVHRTLEEVHDDFQRADAEARAAADDAGRRLEHEPLVLEPAELQAFGDVAGPEPTPAGGGPGAGTAGTSGAGDPDAGPLGEGGRGAASGLPAGAGGAAVEAAAAGAGAAGPVEPEADGDAGGAGDALGAGADDAGGADEAGGADGAGSADDAASAADPEGVEAGPPPDAVTSLFDRIRAGQGRSDTEASQDPEAGQQGSDEPAAGAVTESVEPAGPSTDEDLLRRRDAATGGLERELARRLKRTLQDEQNEVFDRLRGAGRPYAAAQLLASAEDQAARYAGVARPYVEEAARRGAELAASVLRRQGRDPSAGAGEPDAGSPGVGGAADDAAADEAAAVEAGADRAVADRAAGGAGGTGPETGGDPGAEAPGATSVEGVVSGLAAELVTPLRRRVDALLSELRNEPPDVVTDALGPVYREAKTSRVEESARDQVAAGFAFGTWAAVPAGGALRWVASGGGQGCADCDDNTLAGPVPRGEPFPTGQLHPPAHAGCRCLLVPDGAEPAAAPSTP